MITGTHILVYSADPGADRAFFRDVLGFRAVDAGHGWLIFAAPPAELALHPQGAPAPAGGDRMLTAHVYLMCDDVRLTVKELAANAPDRDRVTRTVCASIHAGARSGTKVPATALDSCDTTESATTGDSIFHPHHHGERLGS